MQQFLVTLLVTVNTADTVSTTEVKKDFEDYLFDYENGNVEIDDVSEL